MSRYHVSLQKSTFTCVISPSSLRGCESNVKKRITGFSGSSGVRMRRFLRGCSAEYRVMFTLTYPGYYSIDGLECKRHLKLLFQRINRLWGGGLHHPNEKGERESLFWFLEFQARGAPHFHIFGTRSIDKQWLAKSWYEIVGSDDLRHLYAGTRVESLRTGRGGTISYAAKYAAKQTQKVVPVDFLNVGRFWGVTGNRNLVSAAISVRVTPQNTSELSETFKQCEERLKRGEKAGHLKRVRTVRAGSFSFYALDSIGMDTLRIQMRGFVEEFLLYGSDLASQLCLNRDLCGWVDCDEFA